MSAVALAAAGAETSSSQSPYIVPSQPDGIAVGGFATEPAATGIPSGTAFTAHEFGNVENWSGAQLEAAGAANGVTAFQRPEDAA